MKAVDKQKWREIRAQGHARFIARRGLLFWGAPFGFVVTLWPAVYAFVADASTPSGWSLVGSFIFLTLVFGYGMGETEWRRSERAYRDNAA